MLVREFNEFIQFGFPKDYYLEGSAYWYELYENVTCEYTNKLLLPEDTELDSEALSLLWVLRDKDNSFLKVQEAANKYFDLKINPIFQVGDSVVLVSEKAFYPEYLKDRGNYTAYLDNLEIAEVRKDSVLYSYKNEYGEIKTSYQQFSLEGYKIKPVFDSEHRNKKLVGYTIDYSEYLVHTTEEIIEKVNFNKDAFKSAKLLYSISSELLQGYSVHPRNKHIIDEVIRVLIPMLDSKSLEILGLDK